MTDETQTEMKIASQYDWGSRPRQRNLHRLFIPPLFLYIINHNTDILGIYFSKIPFLLILISLFLIRIINNITAILKVILCSIFLPTQKLLFIA